MSGPKHRYPLIALNAGLMLSGLASITTQASGGPVRDTTDSEFHELALNLRQYSAAIKVDFALAAIAETVNVYQQEILTKKTSKDSEKLTRWSRNVYSYTAELQQIEASITPATAIGIHESQSGNIYLQIGGQPVIISSPRPHQQVQLEHTITRHFCSQYPCDSLLENYSNEYTRGIKTLPHWEFQIEPVPTCSTGDGLALVFSSDEDLLKKRDLCKQLFAELVLLADTLALRRRNGVSIQWHKLAIRPGPESDQSLITLNDRGDAATLAIPGCAASPALLNHVIPWLKSKVEGETTGEILLVITNTEQLMTSLLEK